MSKQDKFLAVTAALVILGLAALTLTGALQYHHDHEQFVNNHQEGANQ